MDYLIRKLSFLLIITLILSASYAFSARSVEIKKKNGLGYHNSELGAYRALVIGINDYKDPKIPNLKTAVHDARAFAELLETRYGFKVTLLLNGEATRQGIMDKMRDLAANAAPDESVLIYYAGHGDLDKVLNDGWWVPADATGGNPATYLDNNYVQRVMRSIKARHVLLVSDSCYSGTLFGETRSLPAIIDDRYYQNLYNEKSRWGMTSGNKTPVSDNGSEGHSIFAYQLIKALKKNDKPYLTTQELFARIAPVIANNSEQQPLCSPIRGTGDQGGGFVFVDSTATSFAVTDAPLSVNQAESDEWVRQKDALEKERQELAKVKQELKRQKALDTERERLAAERGKIEAERQQLAMAKRPPVLEVKEIKRDGRFIAYDNGTVLDTRTNLMWAASDNGRHIDWDHAKSYCENYRGGGYQGWRMPGLNELESLYDPNKVRKVACNKDLRFATDFINMTCVWVWASETNHPSAAYFTFSKGLFGGGVRDWANKKAIHGNIRALPVRSVK